MVVTGEANIDSVMMIHHRRNSIESKSVNLILFQVPGQIRKEEAEDFILGIIEDHTVPSRVMAFLTCMRVAMICSIESVYPIVHVIRCMRMDNIDDNHEAKPMCFIDQILEAIWRALS